MKVAWFAFFLLGTATAFGQAVAGGGSALSAQPAILELPSHPQHATYVVMGHEQSLSEMSTYSYAQGERPLWEVAPVKQPEVPLGDIARALRHEHLKAKKAEFKTEN